MRAKPSRVRSALLLLSLAMVLGMVVRPAPRLAQASQAVTIGSIAYTASADSVIGQVFISNPGFEKTIVYQFPSPPSTSWTTPFFTDLELDGDGGKGHVVGRNFDTTIVLTNTSSQGGVDVTLTFYNQAGAAINGNPILVHIDPLGTQARFASNLLNP